MPKPEILGAVRVGQTTYKAGDEDAFAAAASPAEIARLTEKKVIAGFEGYKSPAPVKAETSADEPESETQPESEDEAPKGTAPKGKGK